MATLVFIGICKRCSNESKINIGRRICLSCKSKDRAVYRNNNKEKESAYHKKYRIENRKSINNQINRRKKDDPLFKFKRQLRCSILQAIKKYNYKKNSKTAEILGCDFNTFVNHIENQFKLNMNWENHGSWHLDHKIPLAKANSKEDLIKLNHYTNFQPLWSLDNLRKGTK